MKLSTLSVNVSRPNKSPCCSAANPSTSAAVTKRSSLVAGCVSASSDSGGSPESDEADTQPATRLERFVTAALVLGLAAEQQGDLFGLLTFTDKVDNFIRARNGQAHYGLCRDALYTLEPA